MSRTKGVALISAVVVMSIVIVFSTLLMSLVMSFSINTRIDKIHLSQNVFINKVYLDFIADGVVGEYEGYYFEIRVNDNNENQKAIVCSNKENFSISDIFFYVIYDFNEQKTLALQRYNQHITSREEEGETVYYLADLIKF